MARPHQDGPKMAPRARAKMAQASPERPQARSKMAPIWPMSICQEGEKLAQNAFGQCSTMAPRRSLVEGLAWERRVIKEFGLKTYRPCLLQVCLE